MKRWLPWSILLIAVFFAFAASAALGAGPSGAGPNDPMMVPTGTQTIAPNATLWFYFDYAPQQPASGPGGGGFPGRGGGRGGGGSSGPSRAYIAVDTNGVQGLQFGVYTPQGATDWMNDPTTDPVGRGTPFTDPTYDTVAHDLYWSGGFNTAGRYFAALTNTTGQPISFTMSITGDTVQLYPAPTAVPSPTLPVPFTPVPVPTGNITGKIVFEASSGGDVYSANGDGSNLTKVTRGMDPSWSADGKMITFTRWDNANPGVFIANADGSNEQLIFGTQRARWPRFSPDGKYVIFSQNKSKGDNNIIWKLGLIELDNGKLTEPKCSTLCYTPSWGTDSATIVYVDPNIGVMTTNAFSGSEALIGPTGSYYDSNAGFSRPILHFPPIDGTELSPDGARIAFSMQAHDRYEVNLINYDGTGQVGITNPDPVLYYLMGVAVHNVAPTWSPDGKQILFLSDRNGKWEFNVVNPDGSGLTQVLKAVTDKLPLNYAFDNERVVDWTR